MLAGFEVAAAVEVFQQLAQAGIDEPLVSDLREGCELAAAEGCAFFREISFLIPLQQSRRIFYICDLLHAICIGDVQVLR